VCLGHSYFLADADMTMNEWEQILKYKPERISDFMKNKRIMPLSVALSIAHIIGCEVSHLYELNPGD
jgi:plasmid maintenance system antidote protein VapI